MRRFGCSYCVSRKVGWDWVCLRNRDKVSIVGEVEIGLEWEIVVRR